ncbi:sulfotransferase [Thalassobaculum sp. OXR-137]|uniref:sulfotransferase n=1 Tax=Thalassobaculum sp. OXR-137 TaxID=3100173 RepID=UPI002AC93C1F|nr:sulfotransferase [Thalassobaculum sp. OXR-137]WPZ33693.1 sulfotransferase [Thalassobaculum sp. OXR-137]
MTPDEFTRIVSPTVLANKSFNKIFCIGYNKTGTTSLEQVLRLYGYRLPDQHEQEIRLSKQVFSTNYQEMKGYCSRFDAFQDMPFSQGLTYVAADALFPDSKFILTERDSDAWFASMCNFHRKVFQAGEMSKLTEEDIRDRFTYLYPGYVHDTKTMLLSVFRGGEREVRWDKLYDKDYYVGMYESRNAEIKRYFSNAPDKLLVIDITQEQDTAKICEFLNIPTHMKIAVPHSNQT